MEIYDSKPQKRWYQPITGHVSYATVRPAVTRMRLLSSLVSITWPPVEWVWGRDVWHGDTTSQWSAAIMIKWGTDIVSSWLHIYRLINYINSLTPGGSDSNLKIMIINTLRPRQSGWHGADDIFKCIFLNKNVWIPMKFVPKRPINNIPALVQIMVWRRPGDKSLSEPMMVSWSTHLCHSASMG